MITSKTENIFLITHFFFVPRLKMIKLDNEKVKALRESSKIIKIWTYKTFTTFVDSNNIVIVFNYTSFFPVDFSESFRTFINFDIICRFLLICKLSFFLLLKRTHSHSVLSFYFFNFFHKKSSICGWSGFLLISINRI